MTEIDIVFNSYPKRIFKAYDESKEEPSLSKILFRKIQLNTFLGNFDETRVRPFKIRGDMTIELDDTR